jgi:predicted secreted protein
MPPFLSQHGSDEYDFMQKLSDQISCSNPLQFTNPCASSEYLLISRANYRTNELDGATSTRFVFEILECIFSRFYFLKKNA